jgi:hypothetical protein
MSEYRVDGNKLILIDGSDDGDSIIATCDNAQKALDILLAAWGLNDRQKYTASARKMAEAESLTGFKWMES